MPPAWRIVHYHDPVPRLGFKTPPFNYVHVPVLVYYTEAQDSYRVCNHSGEDPTCTTATPLWKCFDLDHLTYLNRTFSHKKLPTQCVGTDIDNRDLSRERMQAHFV